MRSTLHPRAPSSPRQGPEEGRYRPATGPAFPPPQQLRPRGASAETRGEMEAGSRTSQQSLALFS
eukprot:9207642-Pyramimonas_sp.AAC.1